MNLMATTRSATRVLRQQSRAFAAVSKRNLHVVRPIGQLGTTDYRLTFQDQQGNKLSPWHHLKLNQNESDASSSSSNLLLFVNEIPKGQRAKMEIATEEAFNPIKQDVKKGKPRFYHSDSLINYGALPQTWEDPQHIDAHTSLGGDNDPIDVVEISRRVAQIGEVYPVKVLGILAMIDDGETDWKVIAIDARDPLATRLEDVSDLAKTPLGDVVPRVRDWFRDYKIPDGKPPSDFAFDGEAQGQEFAMQVINQTHNSWKQLLEKKRADSKLWTGAAHN